MLRSTLVVDACEAAAEPISRLPATVSAPVQSSRILIRMTHPQVSVRARTVLPAWLAEKAWPPRRDVLPNACLQGNTAPNRRSSPLYGRGMAHIDLGLDEQEFPGITGLLRFRPETGQPLGQLADALLRTDSSLSRGERELIAAYVSGRNECRFCCASHSAAAA